MLIDQHFVMADPVKMLKESPHDVLGFEIEPEFPICTDLARTQTVFKECLKQLKDAGWKVSSWKEFWGIKPFMLDGGKFEKMKFYRAVAFCYKPHMPVNDEIFYESELARPALVTLPSLSERQSSSRHSGTSPWATQ